MAMIFFEFPGIPEVSCVFCGRSDADLPYDGNISYDVGDIPLNVRDCRFALFRRLAGRGMKAWRECTQVHGDRILVEPEPGEPCARPQSLEQADGMMTSRRGMGLMIKTADCQPLLLTDSTGSHIMALHVGWRGNRIDFPGTGVRAFCQQYQLSPRDIHAVRGPSLGPGAAEFVNFDTEWGKGFEPWYYQGKMDLWGLTRHQLEKAGVPPPNIHGMDICTYTNDDAWFSYRRDKQVGRQASIIWIGRREDEK